MKITYILVAVAVLVLLALFSKKSEGAVAGGSTGVPTPLNSPSNVAAPITYTRSNPAPVVMVAQAQAPAQVIAVNSAGTAAR